jgi:hypothetical protein
VATGKGVWSEVKSKGQQPTPRWGHSAVVAVQSNKNDGDDDGDATMWVFGGRTETGVDNNLFCFHFRTCEQRVSRVCK